MSKVYFRMIDRDQSKVRLYSFKLSKGLDRFKVEEVCVAEQSKFSTLIVVGNDLLALGGYHDDSVGVFAPLGRGLCYRFDTTDTKTWQLGPWMLQHRLAPQAAVLNGKIYVVGGFDISDANNGKCVWAEVLDTSDDFPTWRQFFVKHNGSEISPDVLLDFKNIKRPSSYQYNTIVAIPPNRLLFSSMRTSFVYNVLEETVVFLRYYLHDHPFICNGPLRTPPLAVGNFIYVLDSSSGFLSYYNWDCDNRRWVSRRKHVLVVEKGQTKFGPILGLLYEDRAAPFSPYQLHTIWQSFREQEDNVLDLNYSTIQVNSHNYYHAISDNIYHHLFTKTFVSPVLGSLLDGVVVNIRPGAKTNWQRITVPSKWEALNDHKCPVDSYGQWASMIMAEEDPNVCGDEKNETESLQKEDCFGLHESCNWEF